MAQIQIVQTLKTSAVFLFLIVSVISCQKKNDSAIVAVSGLIGDGLMSDRPAVETGSRTYLIELKSQALATTSQRNSQGILEINQEHKILLQQEQVQAEKKLKELSTDIKVLYRYQYVLNGMAVVAPFEMVQKIKNLPFVETVKANRIFRQPQKNFEIKSTGNQKVDVIRTSVTFIEAQAAYDQGIRGQNIRVGVLDTGIDYTHSMLGGTGLVDDFKAIDPNSVTSLFPNKKVVGGIDLVGSRFDSASLDPARLIPKPDLNPIDESGHGSHVAGSISGMGDGVQSYDGVAPDATLYAIKVFGSGSTSDEVVIAGLEYAVDPNLDGKFDDQLHVVNLSLGGSNGTPYELYNKAVTNLTRMGTFMVASAGNSSDIPFIVGSPSTSNEALSVAAQIDHTDHNWRFKTIGFYIDQKKIAIAEAVESSISKPISELEEAQAEIVFGGLADRDYSEQEASLIKGKILLIDRGSVTFQEKMVRGEKAGALAIIIAQNRPDAPFTMGGEGEVQIPAVMVSLEIGQKIKAELDRNITVIANFKNPDIIEKPELVGIITDFSSRGPRSYDLLIKPEITAPGQNIISASFGEGSKVVQMSGTSMSGPHMAGVMALMKQKYPNLTSQELKSVVMSTTKQIKNIKGKIESVARQGAGQVLVSRALQARFLTEPVAFSLGLQQIEKEKKISSSLRLKSLGDDDLEIKVSLETSSAAVTLVEQSISLKPRGLTDIKLNWVLKAQAFAGLEDEVTGWVVFKAAESVQKIPFLVRLQKISNIKMTHVELGSSSQRDSENSEVSFEFKNKGAYAGDIWAFNLIGIDDQKLEGLESNQSSECDMKAIGYRINGDFLEIGVKFYRRVTSWALCEVSIMFDQNGDRKPEAELALTPISRIPGLAGDQISTTLIDFKKAQELRKRAEEDAIKSEEGVDLNLSSAVLSQGEAVAGDLRSAATMRIPLEALKTIAGLKPFIQILSTSNESKNVESDDYLKNSKRWWPLSFNPQDQSWKGLKSWTVQSGQAQKVEVTRGASATPMLLIYPHNTLDSRGLHDGQIQIYKPQYPLQN